MARRRRPDSWSEPTSRAVFPEWFLGFTRLWLQLPSLSHLLNEVRKLFLPQVIVIELMEGRETIRPYFMMVHSSLLPRIGTLKDFG
jgi:hypothetical protein